MARTLSVALLFVPQAKLVRMIMVEVEVSLKEVLMELRLNLMQLRLSNLTAKDQLL